MRIVFLGFPSESKKILLMSMARILSVGHTVKIFTSCRYDYDESRRDVYDFCGIEIHNFGDGDSLKQVLESNPCDYALIDTYLALDAGHDVKLASLLQAERSSFEQTAEQTRVLLKQYPFTDICLIFYDVHEYCRISPKFLEKLYHRRIPDSVNVTRSFALYFEEQNAAALLECLFEERLVIKRFSRVWKAQVLNILGSLTGIEAQELKGYKKKAERMRQVCR